MRPLDLVGPRGVGGLVSRKPKKLGGHHFYGQKPMLEVRWETLWGDLLREAVANSIRPDTKFLN